MILNETAFSEEKKKVTLEQKEKVILNLEFQILGLILVLLFSRSYEQEFPFNRRPLLVHIALTLLPC